MVKTLPENGLTVSLLIAIIVEIFCPVFLSIHKQNIVGLQYDLSQP